MPIARLRDYLGWLRSNRYRIVDLGKLVEDLRDGRPIPPRTLAFTVDDGYTDFRELAAPVFAEFDCPVTVFVTTGFIDGQQWFWWDKIEYALSRTRQSSCLVEKNDDESLSMVWDGPTSRRRAAMHVSEWLKYLPAATRDAKIGQLCAALEVELPDRPSAEYAPMTWSELRAMSNSAVTVGPHTVTHPILTMEGPAEVHREIAGSWTRLLEELPGALPIFCYPNGSSLDFGDREQRIIAEAGMQASLSTIPGYVSARKFRQREAGFPQPLPRLQLESDFERFAQVVSGIDRFKAFFRR
jgi:peptidoglycan/xylan/chitin deacetylase (PgdA/CDA1 family)